MQNDTVYYFGYGSNMDSTRMINRGVQFTERRVAKLTGYKFKLNKLRKNGHAAANITKENSSDVYGALYTCTKSCLNKLDKFEGVNAKQYERVNVKVELNSGELVDCITYIALPAATDDGLKSVNRDYLEHILCGEDILPAGYVGFLRSFEPWCVDEESP